MINWILILIIDGQEMPATCEQSLCFERYEDCFRLEIRILTESLSDKITAKCQKLGVQEND